MNLDTLDQAKYLVTLATDNATVVCEAHRRAFELIATSLQMPFEIYELDPEEEPIVCQACHLAHINRPNKPTLQ
jgi:hypothetical protein